jgi:hypothetical protein
VYLEHLTAIEGALTHGGHGKRLNRDKIGEFVLAYDESKRVLSVVATEKVRSLECAGNQPDNLHSALGSHLCLR